ncbi:uncharacterized protein BCR38DRAFT_480086 [Pseudomassariella vexata]|uniref:CFEM domain-containing protein n=1 Tax=Pseudomassariella vexata TaxID=1141098 RepID=A0A1Y2EJV7_9PEZI|nr:uncharacterized protein BCR38DRAFT_480086 [Pseudomassariella vexata]ORY71584.1 hypothetical protein BCR38DRAFT_480086 [Pseudomassariella vexata]
MKFTLIFASAAALIAGAVAQDLPACGVDSLAAALQASGCGQADRDCLCASPSIRSGIENIASACPEPADQQAYKDYYNDQCKNEDGFQPVN